MSNTIIISTPVSNNISVVTDETTVNITQPVTNTIEVLTGPQGRKGDQGPIGPSGSVDTSSLVTTSSFNNFTASYSTGSFTGSFTGSMLGSRLDVVGKTNLKSVQETLVSIVSTESPSMRFDFESASIFYLTNQNNTVIWNIINMPTTEQKATTLTFIIEQGATAYSASAYQFDGIPIAVKWPQGIVPTGSANTTDAIGLTAFRSGSTWNVLGSLTSFL